MPNGILDPNDFTIAPGDMRSLQDRMLEYKRSLPPSLQGQQVGGQPQQTQPEQQQASLGDQINQAAQALAGQVTQQQSQQTGEKPSRKGVQQQLDEYQNVLDQMNPLKPKQAIGGGSLGQMLTGRDSGGILGTGIQPVDVLAFAIGGLLAPKGSSLYRRAGIAMKVGMLPSQFRNFQEGKIKEFAQANLQGINAEIGVANAETAQLKSAQAKQQYDSLTKLANAFRLAGQEGKALALEAGAVTEYEKLTGGTVGGKLPANLQFIMSGIASGAIKDIPPELANVLGGKTPEENRILARGWLEGHLLTQPVIPLPSGGAVQRSVGGPQVIESAPVAPTSRTLTDIGRQMEAARGGQVAAPMAPQAPMAPPSPVAIPAQEPVRRLERTPGGGFMPPTPGRAPTVAPPTAAAPAAPYIGSGQIIDQLSKSPSKQDQWVAKYHSDTPTEVQVKIAPLFQKPMDAGDRQKLVAQASALNFGEKLLDKYDKMVDSLGGEKKAKFTDNMKRYVNELSTRISAEGATASMIGIAADFASAWSQRGKQKFTPEEEDFMAHYAQAQSYARGAMQDAANLATRERDMFRNMVGTLLDTPSMYRSRVRNFLSNIGDNYNTLLKANKLKASDGFEPYSPPEPTRQPPKWFKPLNAPQTQPGGEY